MRLDLLVLGARVAVLFDSGITEELGDQLRRAWSRCLLSEGALFGGPLLGRPPEAPDDDVAPFSARVLTARGGARVAGETYGHFASELTSAVTVCAIEARAGDLLMLHASGLADPRTGRTAALVGRSGVGKTTATKTLAPALGYVSDETVGLERSGLLAPYPKPLSVITDPPPAPKRQIGPDDLGLRDAPSEATLAAVVLLDRSESVQGPCVEAISHAEAIIELAPQTSSLAQAHRPLQWLCSVLDACGGALRVTYREAADLAELLPGLLARTPVDGGWRAALDGEPSVDGSAVDGAAVDGADVCGPASVGLLRRADVVDAVELVGREPGNSELLVMVDQRVVRLSGVAPAIWRALAVPADFAGLAERIAPEIGLPEGYADLLERAITELEGHGVLARL